MIPFMISGDGNITFIANGKQYFIEPSHQNYQKVLDNLKSDEVDESVLVNLVEKLTSVKSAVSNLPFGEVAVVGNQVIYKDENGEEEILHGSVVERLLSMVENNLPVEGLINFIKKCMMNPDYHIIADSGLFDFLDHQYLPICEDGDFLAYKAVREDFTDKHTGTFDNSVGSTVKERRNKVDTNRAKGCSSGLHAGTYEYASGFAGSSDKVVIVKINPMNVVSIPTDCSCQKLRCCEYYVLKEMEDKMDYHLANNEGLQYGLEEDEDDDWDDEDDSYDWWEDDEDDDLQDDFS